MRLDDDELHEPDEQIIAEVLRRTGLGIDFASLTQQGTIWIHLRRACSSPIFASPRRAGRSSSPARAEADGHPRVPRPHADPRPADGRLRLLTPASTWLLNDSFANEPKLARRLGAPAIAVHPPTPPSAGSPPETGCGRAAWPES